MNVIKRITQLSEERGWSTYRLAHESGLSSSTIANIYKRNTVPSFSTLETICAAFGITLSQFFIEDMDSVPLTKEQKELFDMWVNLTPSQKKLIEGLIKEFSSHAGCS